MTHVGILENGNVVVIEGRLSLFDLGVMSAKSNMLAFIGKVGIINTPSLVRLEVWLFSTSIFYQTIDQYGNSVVLRKVTVVV